MNVFVRIAFYEDAIPGFGGRLLRAWTERQALAKTPEACLCDTRGMSLRGGRQADEAIPPPARNVFARRPPGRRSNPPSRKACLCEEAARPTKQSPLSQGMSLRGGRQADEAIPPLARNVFARRPPGRRSNPPSRKKCLCECYDFVKAIFRRPGLTER